MKCPRCGSALDRYALQGREAVACESCGYIGVPVEHHGELAAFESWDDAIERFQQKNPVDAGTVEKTEDDPTPVFDAEGDDATDDATDATDATDDTRDASPMVVRVQDTPADSVVAAANRSVACKVCGKSFEEQAQLDGHMAVHSDGSDD